MRRDGFRRARQWPMAPCQILITSAATRMNWATTYQSFWLLLPRPERPDCAVGTGAARQHREHQHSGVRRSERLAFVPAEGMIGDVAPAVNALSQGVGLRSADSAALNLPKNTTVFQPTPQQIQSAAFQVIVGPPQYTAGGELVGTISDSTAGGGLLEIKGGSATLNSSYQLRLQTYNSVVNNIPMTIETTRPVNPTFMNYLQIGV